MTHLTDSFWFRQILDLFSATSDKQFSCSVIRRHKRKRVALVRDSDGHPSFVLQESTCQPGGPALILEALLREELGSRLNVIVKPIELQNGDLILAAGGCEYMLLPFIHGRITTKPTVTDGFVLGRALKIFQSEAGTARYVNRFPVSGSSALRCHAQAFSQVQDVDSAFRKQLSDLCVTCFQCAAIIEANNGRISTGVVHGDFHLGNVVFSQFSKIEGLLDLEFVQFSEHMVDVAAIVGDIVELIDDDALSESVCAAFISGYGPISAGDANIIMPELLRRNTALLLHELSKSPSEWDRGQAYSLLTKATNVFQRRQFFEDLGQRFRVKCRK